MSIKSTLVSLTFALCSSTALIANNSHAEPVEVPVTANLGLGFGELHSHIDLTASEQRIFSFQPEISGAVTSETLTKLKDKLPPNVPKWLTKAGVSYSPYVLPTIYFTPSNEDGEGVYGLSIGPSLGLNIGGEYLTIGGGVGIMATYLYMDSDLFEENHYITLGANANWNIKLKPIKYFHLEVGQKYIQHIERELSNNEYIGRFREDYVMLHFRFPFTTEVDL